MAVMPQTYLGFRIDVHFLTWVMQINVDSQFGLKNHINDAQGGDSGAQMHGIAAAKRFVVFGHPLHFRPI